MKTPTLDVEKFRKVRGLMERGAFPGERAAAKSRAEAIARKAGLTLAEAIQQDDAAREQERVNFGNADFWSNLKQWAQQERARQARAEEERRKAEEERRRAYWEQEERKAEERFEEAVRRFGPCEDAFAETERERLLREALEPYAARTKFANSNESYIDGFNSWKFGRPPQDITAVLHRAFPLPDDLHGAWVEFREWETLHERRCAYHRDIDEPIYVQCRKAGLEAILDAMPVRCWGDLDLRLQWRRYCTDRWYSVDDEIAFLTRIESDLEILRDLEIAADLKRWRSRGRRSGKKTPNPAQADLFPRDPTEA